MIYYIQSFCQSVIWKFKLDMTATDKRMPVIYISHVVWRRGKEKRLGITDESKNGSEVFISWMYPATGNFDFTIN